MPDEQSGGRTVRAGDAVGKGCVVVVLAWLILVFAPSWILSFVAKIETQREVTPESAVIRKSLRVGKKDLAWVEAAVRRDGHGGLKIETEAHSGPLARAEVSASTPDDGSPRWEWTLRTGFLGLYNQTASSGVLPLPED